MADPPRAEAVQPAQVANFDISQEWSSGRHNRREGIFPTAFMERIKTGFLGEQSEGDGGVQGKAMYDFTADCDEELSMQVGDVIDNLEVLDDDWFLGDLRGRRALVPRTYVQVI